PAEPLVAVVVGDALPGGVAQRVGGVAQQHDGLAAGRDQLDGDLVEVRLPQGEGDVQAGQGREVRVGDVDRDGEAGGGGDVGQGVAVLVLAAPGGVEDVAGDVGRQAVGLADVIGLRRVQRRQAVVDHQLPGGQGVGCTHRIVAEVVPQEGHLAAGDAAVGGAL